MSTTHEFLLPRIQDDYGQEMSQDEILSNWLHHGNASEIPPAYDDSDAPMPDQLADPLINLISSSEAGEKDWRDNQLKQLIDQLDQADRWLIWRHAGQQKSFSEIAAEDGVSKQAAQQRYDRIKRRLNQAALDLPEPDMDAMPADWLDVDALA
jgi:DNA-directed RNA polymerase specialized sigma24 family protein